MPEPKQDSAHVVGKNRTSAGVCPVKDGHGHTAIRLVAVNEETNTTVVVMLTSQEAMILFNAGLGAAGRAIYEDEINKP